MISTVDTGIVTGEHPEDRFEDIETVLRPQVLRMLLCRVSCEDAHDLTQATFAIVFRRFKSFRGEGSRRAWVFGIAERELRAWRRSQSRKISPPEGLPTNPWPGATAGIILREAIQKLSDEQAGAFVLFEVQGFTVREIAELQCVPEGTVLSRLSSARKKLRDILKDGDVK